ncbi:MAG: hypothetical protein LBC80_02735 [Treponema sp.]|jgi:hypothetical protein|nr:hypothetical protein [Treponema sp.]
MKKSSSSGGFKGSSGGFKGASGGFKGTSGGSGPIIGFPSRSTGGRAVRSVTGGIGSFLIFIVIIVLVAAYALLWVELPILFILLGVSTVGIVLGLMLRRPEITPEDKLRESTITQFQVPNTREALTEFTILATQKIQQVSSFAAMFNTEAKRQVWLNKVWITKCGGIYTRARIAMKDDPNNLAEITRLMNKAGVKTD